MAHPTIPWLPPGLGRRFPRYLIMMTTVVDYPAAFEVPSEYDPSCDARRARIRGSRRRVVMVRFVMANDLIRDG